MATPYVAENAEQIDEARKNDYIAPLTKKQDSEGSNFSALDYAGTIDFTYPKATEWYKRTAEESAGYGRDLHQNRFWRKHPHGCPL